MRVKRRKASDIYRKQNTLLHRTFAAAGMPYKENKDIWLQLFQEATGRTVSGLSDLTLGERQKVIAHFQKQGQRIFSPSVPANAREWKKGDPDIEYEFREDADPQIRMVYAMWAEMGYRPKTLRGLCLKRYGKDDPRWLNNEELSRLVNIVKAKAQGKGLGRYYRRKTG